MLLQISDSTTPLYFKAAVLVDLPVTRFTSNPSTLLAAYGVDYYNTYTQLHITTHSIQTQDIGLPTYSYTQISRYQKALNQPFTVVVILCTAVWLVFKELWFYL